MDYTDFFGFRVWPLAACALLACKGGERANPLGDLNPGVNGGGGSSGGGGSGGSGGNGGTSMDAGPDASITNCLDLTCRGAGHCVVERSRAVCQCDKGYVLEGDECVVDETCIQLRILEAGCRQRTATEPALGIFFGLETCAGTTVRPDVLGNVSQAFKVIEDEQDLGDESYASLLERDVESYVAIALDLSGSLQRDQNSLVTLIGTLKQMVASLQPSPGGPPVSVALIVFGRSVHIAQPFTSNFAEVAATLDAIQADPLGAITEPGGTNVFGAVNVGMTALNDALTGRFEATFGSVVATGTLMTITDGRDSAAVNLEAINDRLNLISIGISGNIDDAELTRIGPQGSFLAPAQADWGPAFARVSQRVADYPKRAYLLAYCSPAVAGTHAVSVTLAARATALDATCSFNAEDFGVGVGICNEAFINGYCVERSCGSFLACGACQSDGGTPTLPPNDVWQFTGSN